MHDIQASRDDRGIEIDQVGISGLRVPSTFADGELNQPGIADVEVTVRLQADRRGTHMSRMVEVAQEQLATVNPRELPQVLKVLHTRLDAEAARLSVAMPVTLPVTAPASGKVSEQVHDVRLVADSAQELAIATSVTTDITTVCPCSKAISDYGAHNQRSQVTLTVWGSLYDPYPLSVTGAVGLLRSVGSAPVYPLIKRVDERELTMAAHDNPAFVEDVARDLVARCSDDGLRVSISVRNLESIHSHDAIARII